MAAVRDLGTYWRSGAVDVHYGDAAPNAELRAPLIVAQLVGIAVLRYVVRAERIVRVTDEEIVELVRPAIEQYLR